MRIVGEALSVGRKLYKSNQVFGKWLVTHGFDDISSAARADAMWFASCYRDGKTIPADLTHPKNIRQRDRDTTSTGSLPDDLAEIK